MQRLSNGGTTTLDEETTRKMGYHGGFGAEARLHRHVGIYGDYRYTFIHFGDNESPSRVDTEADSLRRAAALVARGFDVHVGRDVLFLMTARRV